MRHKTIAGYRLYCLDELRKATKCEISGRFLLDIGNRTATILR